MNTILDKLINITDALVTLNEFCINEIQKPRDLNKIEDYIEHKVLSDGISSIHAIKSYIDHMLLQTHEPKDDPENKPVILNKKCNNITLH